MLSGARFRLLRDRDVRNRWQPQITVGVIGICPITELEFLYSAHSKSEREEWLELLNATFAWVPAPDQTLSRAAEIREAMTTRGTHRSAGVVDLLLAAAAELSGLTLIHYDHDFDEIVKVTGQSAVWVAAPGSIT